MKMTINEIHEIFNEKTAMKEAFEAFIETKEKELEDKLKPLFNALKNNLEQYDFLVCAHSHYDRPVVSVFNTMDEEDINKKVFTIDNFHIIDIEGIRDDNFNIVIKITEIFLENLNKAVTDQDKK